MGKMCWEPHYKNTQNDQRRKYTNNYYKPKILNYNERERERERARERVPNKAKTFFTNITKFKQSKGQTMGRARETKEEG
jgi:hypothetical protein